MCGSYGAEELCTISLDGTIRIWSATNLLQLYEFSAPKEIARSVTFHPTENIIVCGFDNGFVRIFSVPTTS